MKKLDRSNSDDAKLCALLKESLLNEKEAYDYVQKTMAYNSNFIDGNFLTFEQVESLYNTGSISTREGSMQAKSLAEIQVHFSAFNYLVGTLDEPLSEEIIKAFHYCLKTRVYENHLNKFPVGEYKKFVNIVGEMQTVSPVEVSTEVKELLERYSKEKVDLDSLVDFHTEFEMIHPFHDSNGVIGRLILFREALRNDICPFIIFGTSREDYIKAIEIAQLGDTTQLHGLFQKEQSEYRDQLYTALGFT